MTRRKALIAIGTVLAGLGGDRVYSEDNLTKQGNFYSGWATPKPTDIIFEEKYFKNFTVRRSNGTKITIPFKEIFDALEGK